MVSTGFDFEAASVTRSSTLRSVASSTALLCSARASGNQTARHPERSGKPTPSRLGGAATWPNILKFETAVRQKKRMHQKDKLAWAREQQRGGEENLSRPVNVNGPRAISSGKTVRSASTGLRPLRGWIRVTNWFFGSWDALCVGNLARRDSGHD